MKKQKDDNKKKQPGADGARINQKRPSPALAAKLFKKGFEPVPIPPCNKACYVDGWSTMDLPVEPWPKNNGIGLRTGNLIGIDIDVYDQKIVDQLLPLFDEFNILTRIGQPPKVLIPVYCPEVTKKIQSAAWKMDPKDKNEKANKIEVLSHGQQFVAYGTHPDTKKPYQWSGSLLTHKPPTVSVDFIERLFSEFDKLAKKAGLKKATAAKGAMGAKGKKGTGMELKDIIAGGVGAGDRNDSAARVAGHYFGDKKTHAEVSDLCREWNQRNRPPLDDDEVQTVVDSIHARHIAHAEQDRGFKPLAIQPWPEPVDGEELLEEIGMTFQRHIHMPADMRLACSLWVMLTYCYDSFRILPMLGVTSPAKRCGKTTLASVIHGLVYHGIMASNLTSAVTYRIVEEHSPTLIVDEMDTFLPDNPELRGIFNSGHTKAAAYVWRCAPKTNEPEMFCTWCPKVLLMIGSLPGTMEDRAIPILLQRKEVKHKVEPLGADYEEEVIDIRSKCYRWAKDNFKALKKIRPNVTLQNSDRAIDNWKPLIAIAEIVGVLELATKAMVKVESRKLDEGSIASMILEDLATIFQADGEQFIPSATLVYELNKNKERPWADYHGDGLTQHKLAAILKPYHVVPVVKKVEKKTPRGYSRTPIMKAYERYK